MQKFFLCIRNWKGYWFMDVTALIILMLVKQLPAVLHEIGIMIAAVLDYLRRRMKH